MQRSIEEARDLVDRILQEARAHNNKALAAIETDPETEALLDVLPERESRQARVHLKGARLWRVQQNGKAKEKLNAARTALHELDLSLARGILRKIDSTVLDESELEDYRDLLLAVEARAVELEDIEGRLPPPPPTKKEKRRRRFRKR